MIFYKKLSLKVINFKVGEWHFFKSRYFFCTTTNKINVTILLYSITYKDLLKKKQKQYCCKSGAKFIKPVLLHMVEWLYNLCDSFLNMSAEKC